MAAAIKHAGSCEHSTVSHRRGERSVGIQADLYPPHPRASRRGGVDPRAGLREGGGEKWGMVRAEVVVERCSWLRMAHPHLHLRTQGYVEAQTRVLQGRRWVGGVGAKAGERLL